MANTPPVPAGFFPVQQPQASPVPDGFFPVQQLQWQGVPGADIPPPPALNVKPQDTAPSAWGDTKAIGAGLAQGTMDAIGAPGTIGDFVQSQLSDALNWDQLPQSQFSGPSLRKDASALTGGATDYQGQNREERILQSGASAVPGAILLGGNPAVNALRYGALPGAASEMAGQYTQGTEYEPLARLGASLAAPLGMGTVADLAAGLTPKGANAKMLAKAIEDSGSTQGQVLSDMSANPRLTAMDVNPTLQQAGIKLVTQGGEPRNILSEFANTRADTAPGVVNNLYDNGMGQIPNGGNTKTYLDNLKATTAANGKQAFDAALNNAGPVDVGPVIAHINGKVYPGMPPQVGSQMTPYLDQTQQALLAARDKLMPNGGQIINARTLHGIQSDMGKQADALMSSPNGWDHVTGKAIADARDKLVGQIDQASGGLFRPAIKQYADDKAIEDAFNKGTTINKPGIENRPEYWEHWTQNASQPEIDAARVGSRVRQDTDINNARNAALKGETTAEVPFNQDRFAILHGQQPIDTMARGLQDERNIARSDNKLINGSKTAEATAANQYTQVDKPGPAGHGILSGGIGGGAFLGKELGEAYGHPDIGMAAGALMGGASAGYQHLRQALQIARNTQMARALSGNATTLRDALNAGPSGPLLSPSRLADPRAAAVAAALLSKDSGQ